MKSNHGFTLIELAITVAIVGILASAAIPFAELSLQRQKENDLRRALREIRGAIDEYHAAAVAGQIPRSVDETGYPKNLDDLVKGVDNIKDAKRSKIYFLRRLPRDPFEDDASRPSSDTWAKRSYSSSPDMFQDGADVFDIASRSFRNGLNGIPYKEW